MRRIGIVALVAPVALVALVADVATLIGGLMLLLAVTTVLRRRINLA